MLATLYNIFQDKIGLNQFAFANADLHVRQNQAIAVKYGVNLPDYILDPISLENSGSENWLQLHQDIHTRTNSVLGIAGNDLSEVDFKNPDQLAAWIWLHAQEHVQASNKLGLT